MAAWDDVTSQQIRETDQQLEWVFAEKLREEHQRGYSITRLASENQMSASQVRQYIRTVEVFPEDIRAQDLPFKVHKVCAKAPNPTEWLDWAVQRSASDREVARAIKQQIGTTPEEWQRQGEWLQQAFLRWAEEAPWEMVQEIAQNIAQIAQRFIPRSAFQLPWEKERKEH